MNDIFPAVEMEVEEAAAATVAAVCHFMLYLGTHTFSKLFLSCGPAAAATAAFN